MKGKKWIEKRGRAIRVAKRIDEVGGKLSETVKQVAQEFGIPVPTVWRDLAIARKMVPEGTMVPLPLLL